jgi:hypothetical protein
MANSEVIVTVASWEPRFWLGFEKLVTAHRPSEVFMYFYAEYAGISEENREKIRVFCRESQITLHENKLSFSSPIESWRTLYITVSEGHMSNRSILVDITTMPRETIWILFDLFDPLKNRIRWVYNMPERYNTEWLSRDPDKPRFVPKMGGITTLGFPTTLLVLSGFDIERTRQMIVFYEPELILLGVQSGSQFENVSKNVERHSREFGKDPIVSLFEVDAYSRDQGLGVITAKINEHIASSNLVMASLGPKPSAVALYRIHKEYPQTGLAYAPSKEFNPNYSSGLGDCTCGEL